MQKCKNCCNPFARKDIIISIWGKSYGPIICDNCGVKNYVRFTTRIILAALIILSLIVLRIFISANIALYLQIIIYLILAAIWVYITPLFARYYIKKS